MKFYRIFFFLFFSFYYATLTASEYFQQEANYTIHVTLNDNKHELSAHESITYKNNSGTTLNELYFHLWPSAYRDRNTIFAEEIFLSGDDRVLSAKDKDFGYIDSLDFTVNGEKVKWKTLTDTIDVCRITLNKPLLPGDSIIIATPFHVKIPAAYLSRLGHNGQAYFISQWYPKPAVFDKNGWNYFPYQDQGEYYSEFGTFDVFITLPENYVLAATGLMMDAEKEKTWLNEKDSITRKINSFPEDKTFPPSSQSLKTIHYHQDRVHDFAWFADKRWHVLKSIIELPVSKKKITTWSFFNNAEAVYWKKSPEYIRDAINYFSEWVGEYPYESITMVDVGNAMSGGMEYPMVATVGNSGDPFQLELTIAHEAAHNWFYGILGSDEHCHAWMDEGITNFYETRYVYTKYKSPSTTPKSFLLEIIEDLSIDNSRNHRKKQYLTYLGNARINIDQPPSLCSDKISNKNYHANVYYKTSVSFDFLKSYLGDSMFDACMKAYYQNWKFKHPQPDDLKKEFEIVSGKNLDWFFNDIITTKKKLDYKLICAKEKEENKFQLQIKNKKELASPLLISGLRNDSIIDSYWQEGFQGKKNIDITCKDCDAFRIDANQKMPELYQSNNFSRIKGLFATTEKIKLTLGVHPENPKYTFINYFPVIGWNYYNKLMAGIVLHNISPFEEKFEYTLMPLYAFGTSDLAGGGNLGFHFYPNNSIVRRIEIRSGIAHYALGDDYYESPSKEFIHTSTLYYTKVDSRIIFSFFQKKPQEHFKNELTLRNIFINRDIPYIFNYAEANKNLNYWQVEYKRENTNPLKKSLQRFNVIYNGDFYNVSGELKNFLCYGKKNKGFEIRLFAGVVDVTNNTTGIDYRMSLSGRTGPSYDLSGMGAGDYLFDEVFLGRSENTGILSHQFVNDYAGFRTPTLFYRLAEKWMAGFNTTTTLPGKIPFRLFANVGAFDDSDQDGTYGKVSWEIGVDLPVIKDIFVISLPFAYSNDIQYIIDNEELNTADLIRFELHLNLLNPLTFVKNIYTK